MQCHSSSDLLLQENRSIIARELTFLPFYL